MTQTTFHKKTQSTVLRAAMVLALASVLPALAHAAETNADQSAAGDQLVKMDKIETVASSTDRSNNLLNEQVREAAPTASSAIDLMQSLPGVLVNQGDAYGGDDWSTRIYVRGFQEGQLGFSVDGVPNGATNYGGGTKPNRFIDPENVSTLSVSQGSGDVASAGAQALGGTFNYTTLAPSSSAGLFTAYSFGDNQLSRIFARYNTGLVGGNTRAFVSISDQSHHRWMDTGSEAGITTRTHVDAHSLTTLGSSEFSLRFSYDDIFEPNYDSATLADYAQTPGWDGLTGEWTGSPNTDQNYIKGWNTIRKNSLLSLNARFNPSDDLHVDVQPYWQHQKGSGGWLPPYLRMGWDAQGKATNNASFAKTQARAFFQDKNGNLLAVGDPTTAPAGVTFYTPSNPFDINTYPEAVRAGAKAVQSYRTSTYLFDRTGTTLNADWKVTDNNTLKAGAWFEYLDRKPGRTWHKLLDTQSGWDSDANAYWSDFLSNLTTKTSMLYVQDTAKLGAFSLNGGLRQYFVDLKYSDEYHVRPNRSLNSDSDLLPSLGAVYSFGPHMGEVFGGYSKNFKAIEDNIIAGTDEVSKSLKPETSDSIDAGYRLTRGRFSSSLSFYDIQFKNRITSVTPRVVGGVTNINYDIGQNGGYVNVGGIKSRGVELANYANLNSWFGYYASLTANNSEYSADIPENGVIKGKQVVGSPELMGSLSVFVKQGGYHASLGSKYTGKRYGTLDNKESAGAYTLFDAGLGYQTELGKGRGVSALGIDLKVQNLFDKSYLSGVEGASASAPAYYFIGSPRTISMTVSVQF